MLNSFWASAAIIIDRPTQTLRLGDDSFLLLEVNRPEERTVSYKESGLTLLVVFQIMFYCTLVLDCSPRIWKQRAEILELYSL